MVFIHKAPVDGISEFIRDLRSKGLRFGRIVLVKAPPALPGLNG